MALESGGSGGVVWRIKANPTKLVCAVGSRNGTEETKLLVLDFDSSSSSSNPSPAGAASNLEAAAASSSDHFPMRTTSPAIDSAANSWPIPLSQQLQAQSY